MIEKIKSTAAFIKETVAFEPEVGIILGTGLGGLVNHIGDFYIEFFAILKKCVGIAGYISANKVWHCSK